uniref:Protein-tyrosine sulfotransferase n=1 Tax=Alexandrium monilatum TaxID=311494 RepID=A0A7S4R5E2_9DINO
MWLRAASGLLLCLHASALRWPEALALRWPGAFRARGIRVIGAGHQRTGTESMTAALLQLGYNPAHAQRFFARKPFKDPYTGLWLRDPSKRSAGGSMLLQRKTEVAGNLSRRAGGRPISEFLNQTVLSAWMDFANGGSLEPALQTLFDNGFDATTADMPTFAITKQLVERYPQAKVILTVHPRGADAWVEAMLGFCWTCTEDFTPWMGAYGSKFSPCIKSMLDRRGALLPEEREACAREYEEYNEDIKRSVPPHRLLVFSPGDGWDPLVRFLGVPRPPGPFPYVNRNSNGRRRRSSAAQHQ